MAKAQKAKRRTATAAKNLESGAEIHDEHVLVSVMEIDEGLSRHRANTYFKKVKGKANVIAPWHSQPLAITISTLNPASNSTVR